MVRVGLIGCGTIGSSLARTIERTYRRTARLVALHDTNRTHAESLQRSLASQPAITSLSSVIRRSHLVIEAASVNVAAQVVARALGANRDVLVMSVGGLLADRAWWRIAQRSRGKLYIPSGALAGIDGVKALATGTIRRATLTTRKPPRALASAPYVQQRGLRLDRLTKPMVIFEGTPREVVKRFPQNTNVATVLALASGARPARMRIRVVADPTIRVNRHELEVEGDVGRLWCTVQSRPSTNLKTSELAVRSAMVTLGRLFEPVVIGT